MIRRRNEVLALSSGFMLYPLAVHPCYSSLSTSIAARSGTFVLLPSLDRETCVAETVRRQLSRPTGRRGAAREEAVIRERFERYISLRSPKLQTMRRVNEVVDNILMALAAD